MKHQVPLSAQIVGMTLGFFATAHADDNAVCSYPDATSQLKGIVTACTLAIEGVHESTGSLPESLWFRARAYHDMGQSDLAMQDLERAIKLKPGFPEAFLDKGDVCVQMGDYDCAIQSYGEAIALKPDLADAYNNRGVVYFRKNDLDRALSDLNKAIALKPTQAAYWFNRGIVYSEVDCATALLDFAQAGVLNPLLGEQSGSSVCSKAAAQ